MKYKVKKVGDFESNIEIDIDFEDLESKKDEAISKISKSLKVKGFRPGKIPKNIVIREVGEDYILEESIDLFLPEQIFEILQKEEENDVTILKVKGVDMIGESKNILLDDIDLHKIEKCVDYEHENKNLCFRVGENYITEMNYDWGPHSCDPKGNVKYSEKTYINKHMAFLGLEFIIDKMIKNITFLF